jgi:hypothetical protein
MGLDCRRIVIIGGASGIGLAAALWSEVASVTEL